MSKRVWRAAFTSSLPVLMGYLAMGIAAGVLLASSIPRKDIAFWAFLTSGTSISGALQFLLVPWISAGTPMVTVALLTVFLNLRYAMYGFSLLERFRGIPLWKKCYLIWTLTDETYALEVENRVPAGENSLDYCMGIAFLDHCYWVCGVTFGALAGAALPIPSRGIDFAMTALFLVILTDQCRARENRIPALIGAGAALVSRLFFPVDRMLIPAMVLLIGVFFFLRRKLDGAPQEEQGRAA